MVRFTEIDKTQGGTGLESRQMGTLMLTRDMSVEHRVRGLSTCAYVQQKSVLESKILNRVISVQMVVKAMIVDEIARVSMCRAKD